LTVYTIGRRKRKRKRKRRRRWKRRRGGSLHLRG
jgi:hypothetical protein